MADDLMTHIVDHRDRAVLDLPSRDRRGARKVALVRGIAAGVQVVEDLHHDLLLSSRLEVATGWLIDVWGAVVGERRGAIAEHTVYRRFVMARAQVNACKGNADGILSIWILLMEARSTYYRIAPPAGFILYAVRSSLLGADLARRVRRLMRDAKQAGVSMSLVQSVPGYFGFDGDPEALGFDDGTLSEEITG